MTKTEIRNKIIAKLGNAPYGSSQIAHAVGVTTAVINNAAFTGKLEKVSRGFFELEAVVEWIWNSPRYQSKFFKNCADTQSTNSADMREIAELMRQTAIIIRESANALIELSEKIQKIGA